MKKIKKGIAIFMSLIMAFMISATNIKAVSDVKVTQITVNSDKDTEIVGMTIQMNVAILPTDATNKEVTWSIDSKGGNATISETGLFTAKSAGLVNVVATAKDGSGIVGTKAITITPNQINYTASYQPNGGNLGIIDINNTYALANSETIGTAFKLFDIIWPTDYKSFRSVSLYSGDLPEGMSLQMAKDSTGVESSCVLVGTPTNTGTFTFRITYAVNGLTGAGFAKRTEEFTVQVGTSHEHTISDWIIDKEATSEASGSKHKECTVCGAIIETVEIPKLASTPNDPVTTPVKTDTTPATGDSNIAVVTTVAMLTSGLIALYLINNKKNKA